MKRNFPRQQRGYILALNLAVLALMLIGASYVGQRVSDAVRLAHAEQQSVDIDYQLETARAKLLMLLATAPRSLSGLGTGTTRVMLDGRPYRMDGDVVVTLQDERGLVSLNGLEQSGQGRERMERLLGTWGVAQTKASAMTDALLDYRDADDLRRLNGAELQEYRSVGAEADLRNTDLVSAMEAPRIYGWRDATELWGKDSLLNHVSAQRGAAFNPNTATWRALVAMSALDEATAKGLIQARNKGESADIASLAYGPGLGDPFGPLSNVLSFAGATVVVTLRSSHANWGYRVVVMHTPGEKYGPWRISSHARVPLEALTQPLEELPLLPPFTALRDVGPPPQIKF